MIGEAQTIRCSEFVPLRDPPLVPSDDIDWMIFRAILRLRKPNMNQPLHMISIIDHVPGTGEEKTKPLGGRRRRGYLHCTTSHGPLPWVPGQHRTICFFHPVKNNILLKFASLFFHTFDQKSTSFEHRGGLIFHLNSFLRLRSKMDFPRHYTFYN